LCGHFFQLPDSHYFLQLRFPAMVMMLESFFLGVAAMLTETTPGPKSPWKNPLVYSSIFVLIVGLAVGFIMYSRWQDARARDREAQELRTEKQREEDRAAVEQLGGRDFAILDFYASPRVIRRGETGKLCYGVSNAKTVQLEPESHAVWPSEANCVDVSPVKTTTYTLTIFDAAGHSKSQTVDLVVR
jgi:hypothetical protein